MQRVLASRYVRSELCLALGLATFAVAPPAGAAVGDTFSLFASSTPGFTAATPNAVPAGICYVTVRADGGRGGDQYVSSMLNATGGWGASIRARVPVVPGDHLAVQVGGLGGAAGFGGIDGSYAGSGGVGGGGGGGNSNGGSPGGGGASAVSSGSGKPLVVAGGGGGAGFNSGGGGGSLAGFAGSGNEPGSGGLANGTGGAGGAASGGQEAQGGGGGVGAGGSPNGGSGTGTGVVPAVGGGGGGGNGLGTVGNSGGSAGGSNTGLGGAATGAGSGGAGNSSGGNGGTPSDAFSGAGGGGGIGFGGGGAGGGGGGGGGYGGGGGGGAGSGGGGGSSFVIPTATSSSYSSSAGDPVVNITYDVTTDVCPPSLSIGDVTQAEGDSGPTTLTFTVSLSAPANAGGVTFDIATADGSGGNAALSSSDYVAKSLTGQTISEGNSSYNFTVTVNGDTDIESNELFKVLVSNVSGAVATDAEATGTITNDDVAVACMPGFYSATGTAPCTPASKGYYVDTPGATAQKPCPSGSTTTATAQTSCIHINQAPSFNKGPDKTVLANSPAQTVSPWATAISPGPASESGQRIAFIVTNDNNPLFSAQPSVDDDGTLHFTPAANQTGVAIVSVQLRDDGGTDAGGVDTSGMQQFTITVNQAPTFAPDTSPPLTASVGQPYGYPFVASGYPVPTYALASGAPSWLTIDATSGLVGGTPPTGTTSFTYTVVASNVAGSANAGPYKVTVAGPPPASSKADLSASLSCPASTRINVNTTCTLTVRNAGPAVAKNVWASLALPWTFTKVSNTSGGTWWRNVVIWKISSLAANTSTSFSVTFKTRYTGKVAIAAATASTSPDPNWKNNFTVATETITK